MANLDRYLYPQVSVQRIVPMILWPISVMMVIQRALILGVNGSRTDDFKPVYAAAFNFLNNLPVYGENYDTVSPHYLYPPSGTLLMLSLIHISEPTRPY